LLLLIVGAPHVVLIGEVLAVPAKNAQRRDVGTQYHTSWKLMAGNREKMAGTVEDLKQQLPRWRLLSFSHSHSTQAIKAPISDHPIIRS